MNFLVKLRKNLGAVGITLLLGGCVTTQPLEVKSEKDFPFLLNVGEPKPTVLIAHGCGGWRVRSHFTWAMDLKAAGFNAVVLNSFEPRGFTEVCNKGMLVPPSLRALDIDNVAKWVKSQAWHKGGIAVMGFSHGASTALNIANNKKIQYVDAVVAFYPYCGQQNGQDFIGESIANPLLAGQLHLALKDSWTPPELCKSREQYETFTYSDATHGFDIDSPKRFIYNNWMEYDADATALSKSRTIEFLKRHLLNKG